MEYNFDKMVSRRGTSSYKWDAFSEEKLPMWVADMDFESPEPVIRALRERVDHGVFGYTKTLDGIKSAIIGRMKRLYDWEIVEDDILFVPGVVLGFNLAAQALTESGDSMVIQPPVYGPFFGAAKHAEIDLLESPLILGEDHRYRIDYDDFAAKAALENNRLFLLCNPHNPTGRAFTREELTRIGDLCVEHDLYIISDEIHCDLVFSGHRHVPIASLSPEIAQRTVTLMAPSKTFNIAGLEASFYIIQNEAIREKINSAKKGIVPYLNLLSNAAMKAAYEEGQEWLDQLLVYLEDNRDYVTCFVNVELPGCKMGEMDATYLAWIDCREAGIGSGDEPREFFFNEADVVLNPGSFFGQGGEGFVRFNFGCPRSMVVDALDRMKAALERKAAQS